MTTPHEDWREKVNDALAAYSGNASHENYKTVFDVVVSEIEQARKEGYEEGLNLRKDYNDPELIKQIQAQARESLREEWVQKIKDSFWVCPSHEEVDPIKNKGCGDCSEAASVNIILLNLLQSPPQ